MPTEFDIVEGLDPTPLPSISASQLLQMIHQAVLASNRGMVIYSSTTPDVVTNPQLTRYVWANTTTDPYVLYVWSIAANAWVVTGLAIDSINGNVLIDGSVSNLKLAPGTPSYILRTKLDGTATEWVPFILSNQDISTLLAKGSNGQLIRTSLDGSTVQWFTFNISDFLTPYVIPLTAIDVEGPANTVMAVDPTGLFLTMVDVKTLINVGTFAVNKLVPGAEGSILRTIGGIPTWNSAPIGLLQMLDPAAAGNPIISLVNHGAVAWTTVNVSALVPATAKALILECVMFSAGGIDGSCYIEGSSDNVTAAKYKLIATGEGAATGFYSSAQAIVPVKNASGVITFDYRAVWVAGLFNTTINIAGVYL